LFFGEKKLAYTTFDLACSPFVDTRHFLSKKRAIFGLTCSISCWRTAFSISWRVVIFSFGVLLYRICAISVVQACRRSCSWGVKDELLVKLFAGYLVPKKTIVVELERNRAEHLEILSVYQCKEQRYFQNPQELPLEDKFRYLTLRRSIYLCLPT
jgi:hypothetical protein